MHPPAPLPDPTKPPPAREPITAYSLEELGMIIIRPAPGEEVPVVGGILAAALPRRGGFSDGRPAIPEPPLVEKYLHSGELAKGEQALEAALAASPKDDQLRFGLGVLRFARAVERLCQSLHQYGVKPENTSAPFLRLPVPGNDDPAPISDHAFRRVLDDLVRDLTAAETTLAGITDPDVKLPLRLAAVRFDLTGSGKATDKFSDILRRLMRQDFDFLKANPEFLVCFDRGDVAWLRAYCHLLMAMADFYLAFDTAPLFDDFADRVFARPKKSARAGEAWRAIGVKEPARLARFRKHMLAVCALNRETWKFILAETDDDHEWLPNPKQKGVLGLPVRSEMVESWLEMVGEVEAMLEGKKLIPVGLLWPALNGKGLNLKTLLDDPPARFDFDTIVKAGPAPKYLEAGQDVNLNVVFRLVTVFGDSLSVAYAAWFN
jgi:hypothetical protein